ncbi:MAG: hypothetical protein R6V10_02325 [bacterium]
MDERVRKCIFCGKEELMTTHICTECQEKIQKEVMLRRENMRKEALAAIKKYGSKPDGD